MYVYNVTIKVAEAIQKDWLHWLKLEHIPDVMGTGCFETFCIFQLKEVDESEGPTYVVQYTAATREKYDLYIDNYAQTMRARSYEKWGDQFIAFRTLLEKVS